MGELYKHEIDQLSKHLFWDVQSSAIDLLKNKKWLIRRVLEYGLLSDWLCIYRFYGIKEIAETAMTLKDLDKKTASFISSLSNIPKEKFECYSSKQSNPPHWNF